MFENETPVNNFAVWALQMARLAPAWPPWLPHGGKSDPFGDPIPPLGQLGGPNLAPWPALRFRLAWPGLAWLARGGWSADAGKSDPSGDPIDAPWSAQWLTEAPH